MTSVIGDKRTQRISLNVIASRHFAALICILRQHGGSTYTDVGLDKLGDHTSDGRVLTIDIEKGRQVIAGVGGRPEGAILLISSRNAISKEALLCILQRATDDAGGAGGDDDSSDQPVDDSDPLDGATSEGHDTHLVPQYDGDSDEDIVDQIKADVESVERVIDQALDDLARSEDNEGHKQVNTSESIAQSGGRVRAINASSVDWRSALADRATAMSAGEESSWKRINRRRLVNTGVISPSKIGTFNRIGITVDTSWSCMRYESTVSAFFNEAASLIDTLAPRSGAVLVQCGESVRQVDEPMSGSEFLDVDVSMGGGTYMAASVEWMEANGVDCDIHLIFTDGEMCDEDYRICAESDAILILVKHPDFWTRKMIDESGIDYIVASDDPLAA